MVVTLDLTKRKLKQEGTVFQVASIYKIAKQVAEDAGYGFVEVSHRSKPGKYGHLYEFDFMLGHKYDFFAMDELDIELVFEDTKKVKRDGKVMEQGDAELKIVTKLTLDYANEWGTSRLNKFLFTIYQKYIARERIKKKYMIPSIIFTEKVYSALKEGFEQEA